VTPRPGIGLGPGAEFRRIEALLAASGAPGPGPDVLAGPGDDAAVLRPAADESIVVSSDLSVEGVHFHREWLTWEEVGWRAVASGLSDLAAMGARPLGVLVSLAVPPETDDRTLAELASGLGDLLRSVDTPILGGDLSRSPGTVVLDVVALGADPAPVGRGDARPGDELWVTGRLGGAAVATAAWTAGLEPSPEARAAFARPRPRIGEMRWLRQRAAIRAAIDLSDGLLGDAGHLSTASGVAIQLEAHRIPLHATLEEYANRRAAEGIALAGGEDYELLLAAPSGSLEPLRSEFEARFDLSLTRVGVVRPGDGVRVTGADGRPVTPARPSFDHFGG
jgi:thiamine-monophosphate kinase